MFRRLALPLLASVAGSVLPAADAVAQGSVETDRAALEALYDATGGPAWTNSTNWKTAAPLGEWHGVTTDDTGRVALVHLHSNALAGPIPSSLGSLPNLRHLVLWDNALTGPIPPVLGSLPNLEYLHLGGNALSGPIPPALGGLAALQWLVLSANSLSGPIPSSLGGLANLTYLHLGGNALSGPIPSSLGGLAKLKNLNLGVNTLSGPIPSSLGSLTNLEELGLAGNRLAGPVTGWLAGLTNLEGLNLRYNWGMTGPVPASLSRLRRLELWMTQACAPAAWRASTETIHFDGALCGAGPVTMDVAVVYTRAARRAAGGTAAI